MDISASENEGYCEGFIKPIAFQELLTDCPIDSLLAIKTVQCLCVGQENANRSKLTSDEKRRLIQEVQKHPVIINVHPGVPVSPLSDNNISLILLQKPARSYIISKIVTTTIKTKNRRDLSHVHRIGNSG